MSGPGGGGVVSSPGPRPAVPAAAAAAPAAEPKSADAELSISRSAARPQAADAVADGPASGAAAEPAPAAVEAEKRSGCCSFGRRRDRADGEPDYDRVPLKTTTAASAGTASASAGGRGDDDAYGDGPLERPGVCYICGCCCLRPGGNLSRYPHSSEFGASWCCCLNARQMCCGYSCAVKTTTLSRALCVTCCLSAVFLVTLIIAAYAYTWNSWQLSGVMTLVCIGEVTPADAQYVPGLVPLDPASGGGGAPWRVVQLTVWDVRPTDSNSTISSVLDVEGRPQWSFQFPTNETSPLALPVALGLVSPALLSWRVSSNATSLTEPPYSTTNVVCARGVALLLLTSDREADAVAAFGQPLERYETPNSAFVSV